MPDSTLLEIALGLAFVFLLFSMLVSAANEILVALFKSRSAGLWDGVGMLLNGQDGKGDLRKKFFEHPLVRSISPPQSWGDRYGAWMSDRRKAPSYLEARTFSVALLDLLKEPHGVLGGIETELKRTVAELRAGDTGGVKRAAATLRKLAAQMPDTPLGEEVKRQTEGLEARLGDAGKSAAELAQSVDDVLQALPGHWMESLKQSAGGFSKDLEGVVTALANDAAGSIESFREGVERWYDEGMSRVSGWYKRWTQAVQIGLGLVLAVSLNIDAVNIVRSLEENTQLRRTLASRAEAYARTATLDARNVVGERSSGEFDISLQSPDARTFDLKSLLPEDLPTDVAFEALKVTVKPSSELADFGVECEEARQSPEGEEPRFALIPCEVTKRVSARSAGGIEVKYEWQEGEDGKPKTRTASVPVVLVPDAEKQFEDIERRLKESGLPIGWANPGGFRGYIREHHVFAVLGWLLSALAASLGAPFWFDLLKRVANLRASGPSAGEKKPKPASA